MAQARVAVIIIERDVHVDPAPEPGLKAGELRGELFLRVVRRQLLRRYALCRGIREGGVIVAPNFAHGCSPVDGSVVMTRKCWCDSKFSRPRGPEPYAYHHPEGSDQVLVLS